MAENSLMIKRTYGEPNIEYCDSYVRGFEVLEDQFLLLTLTHNDSENFKLKIPLNHLDIQYGRFILDFNINDDASQCVLPIPIDGIEGVHPNSFKESSSQLMAWPITTSKERL